MSGSIGAGSAGTCFSGGAGSGGTYGVVTPATSGSDSAGINGGAGTAGTHYGAPSQNRFLAGAGNPGGFTGVAAGTGGVLIIFVEGTITKEVIEGGDPATTKFFTANGVDCQQTTQPSTYDTLCNPFGGGSGGGIVIVVNNDATNLQYNVQANGGIVARDGPGGVSNFQSAGNGDAVVYTFGAL